MSSWFRCSLAVMLLSCQMTLADSTPVEPVPPTIAETSTPATANAPFMDFPTVTAGPQGTRVTFTLPARANYTLTPTFDGLRIDVAGVRTPARTSHVGNPNPLIVKVTPSTHGAVILLGTPYPLGLHDGWTAKEQTGTGGRLVLTIDLSPMLVANALDERVNVLPQVLSEHDVPPGDTSAPISVPKLPALDAAQSGPAANPNTLSGQLPGTAMSGQLLPAPRIGKHPGATRVVFDLPGGTAFRITPQGTNLRVELKGVQAQDANATNVSTELIGWRIDGRGASPVVTLTAAAPLTARSGWRNVVLPPTAPGLPHRLVIDLSPAFADRSPLTAAERKVPPVPTTRQAQLPLGTAAATFLPALPLEAPRVVLDPGHGGRFPGAVGAVVEKDVTLNVALRVRDLLRDAGVEVVMTRDTDRHLSEDLASDLSARAALAVAPAKLMVSIHANSTVPAKANTAFGVETWWNDNHSGSRALAGALQRQLERTTAAFSRGLKDQQSLAVLRHSKVPAALVEIGFASHPVDGENLQSDGYLDRVALGIALGIRQALDATR